MSKSKHPSVIVGQIRLQLEDTLTRETDDVKVVRWQRMLALLDELDEAMMVQVLEMSNLKLGGKK